MDGRKSAETSHIAALRAVLHALRDRLTVEEAAHLAAQLPKLIRGLYYQGWEPGHVPVKMHRQEFLERVRSDLPFDAGDEAERLVQTVLSSLRRHVTDGEWDNVRATMPTDLAAALP
jgi:uncharacterized protein (DUF2267 family)